MPSLMFLADSDESDDTYTCTQLRELDQKGSFLFHAWQVLKVLRSLPLVLGAVL